MKSTRKASLALAALALSVLAVLGLSSCGKKAANNGKVKAGFIYVGPLGDLGWTAAHEQARAELAAKYDWLETKYVESVPEGKITPVVNQLFKEEKMDVVFTTSFGYMDESLELAKKYPKKIVMHCSGFKREKNLGTYFADLYQIYYLNGLMAGALTKSNKIGYVGAFPTSEVIRHIDAFALGIKAVNPKATVEVIWINSWYDPTKAREAAQALIAKGVDALAFTEDSASVVEVGEESTKAGKQVYTFSHYSPMQSHGPSSCVSGQMVNWTVMYDKVLNDIKNKTWKSEDLYWILQDGAVELGANPGERVNPVFEPALAAKKVSVADLGEVSVYDLVMARYDAMKAGAANFEPFTGPILAQGGEEKIAAGATITMDELINIKYFVDNVIGEIPSGN